MIKLISEVEAEQEQNQTIYDYQDKRPPFAKFDANIPGPGNYNIKGFADEIVDKAKARSLTSAKKSSNVSKSDVTNNSNKYDVEVDI